MALYGEEKRKYQREWLAKRRQVGLDYLGGRCASCGTTDKLELDHIDPSTKVDHKIWSWKWERQIVELDKCQLLCETCHTTKTLVNGDYGPPKQGEKHWCAKISDAEALQIRDLYAYTNMTQKEIAIIYGISRQTVGHITTGYHWKHL
jgi:DNA-binding XRE family transcriptional regulator